MKLVVDPHAVQRMTERGVDLSILLVEYLQNELKELMFGQKLVKTHKGTTVVFKKSNSSDTVYIKSAWASYAPVNNQSFKGAK